jgi:PilZ domain
MRREPSAEWLSRISDWLGRAWLDQRDRKRLRANFNVSLEAAAGLLHTYGVDASRRGIGVLSRQPVTHGSLVFVSLSDLDLSGFAYVRHCTACADGTFRLGLNFRESLHRKRPEPGKWTYRRASYNQCGTWDDTAEIPAPSPQ